MTQSFHERMQQLVEDEVRASLTDAHRMNVIFSALAEAMAFSAGSLAGKEPGIVSALIEEVAKSAKKKAADLISTGKAN